MDITLVLYVPLKNVRHRIEGAKKYKHASAAPPRPPRHDTSLVCQCCANAQAVHTKKQQHRNTLCWARICIWAMGNIVIFMRMRLRHDDAPCRAVHRVYKRLYRSGFVYVVISSIFRFAGCCRVKSVYSTGIPHGHGACTLNALCSRPHTYVGGGGGACSVHTSP